MGKPQQLSVLVAHPSADLYGSDRVLLASIDGLIRDGARVLVTLPSSGPLVPELTARGARVVLCPTPVLRKSLLTPRGALRLAAGTLRGSLAGLRLLRGSRPDVLLANTITVPLWTVLARLYGVPVVTHVHEAEAHAPRAVRALLALPLTLSTGIVANSRFSSETLGRSLPWLRDRAVVVYNGVPGPPSPVPPRRLLDGGLRVLYLGRLSHRKGVDVAVDAVMRLSRHGRPAHLDIVGAVFPGNEAYEAGLRGLVAADAAGASVTFHGFQNDVWPYLAAADVVVVPSRLDEPFGDTAVEALLASRPVVASSTSGLREAAGGYASVQFVEPGSAPALAAALEAVASHWGRYSALAATDAVAARERHSPEQFGSSMSRHISAAAGRR